ncbi:mechanosensitive ion channel family protein [Edaphobacillus lindanitolerans]|uniref:Small conductance mechanosensitive channel n=1 Tax=Edaphobacillus lindanitolerans TaxID=550447 RepID=A0A1U7PR29_9BACI|nr:mechanosensitive ion channel family protein [Edaphobacillus lindanitolerans]SIT87063.1 small conductance mechanosensitive channel [Edaphobacillus lindanitolerans]
MAQPETPVSEEVSENVKETFDMINSFKEMVFSEDTWIRVGFIGLKILVIILLSALFVRIGKTVIRRAFSIKLKGPIRTSERRERTLIKLLENILAYVVYFSAIMAILSIFEINVAGLLAGAGVLGLAVGFGAQSLVKDVISGFFVIFEDQFSVGDYVKIGEAEGTVQEIGLRTTKIKTATGELYIIPNGSITEVVNSSIYNSTAIIDISIARETDLQETESLIRSFLSEIMGKEEYEEILSPPELLGVQRLEAHEVILRIIAETAPMMQFAAERKLRKDLKQFLEDNHIETAYPKMVMVDKESPKSTDS